MKLKSLTSITVLLALAAGTANAEGKLNIYNWTDYTSPDVITKFEKETGIKVTLDTYDSNETLLAKLQAGAKGYDIIIPSHNFVPILIKEGLVQQVDVAAMPNYANVDDRWKKPEWDPEQKYTAPFHMGSTSIAYRRDLYGKDLTSLGEYFEPTAEVQGRISDFKTPEEMVNLAHMYLGQKFCSEDPAEMQKVQDLLVAQKPSVMAYSSEGMNDRLVNGDVVMTSHWSGGALRGRELGKAQGEDIAYAYPKEGVIGWMDNIMIPAKAENVENAKKFMDFMMNPENMAIQSNFTGYGNAIKGSDKFMTEELRTAPEINPPAGTKMVFSFACSAKAQGLIDRVWTNVLR